MNRSDAEDLVQELCIRAFPRLLELEKMDDPMPWLAVRVQDAAAASLGRGADADTSAVRFNA